MKHIIFSLFLITSICTHAFSKEIPFTQEDRDRMIRTELRLEEFQKQSEIQYQSIQKQFDAIDKQFDAIDKQFDGIQKQFDGVHKQFDGVHKQFDGVQNQFVGIQKQLDNQLTFLYWGFGILIAFMGFLMGLVIWDRRSAIAPVKKETEDLKFENKRLLDVLRKYAEKSPDIREILKNAGLL